MDSTNKGNVFIQKIQFSILRIFLLNSRIFSSICLNVNPSSFSKSKKLIFYSTKLKILFENLSINSSTYNNVEVYFHC